MAEEEEEEINRLRNRVDAVLHRLVNGSALTADQSQTPAFMTTSAGDLPIEHPPMVLGYRRGSNGERSVANGRGENESIESKGAHEDDDDGDDVPSSISSSSRTATNRGPPKSVIGDGKPPSSSSSHWIVDPYGDQGEYTGPITINSEGNKLPNGFGTMLYTDGRIYTGEWKVGQWHGQGRATFSNGDVFEGHYHQDQRHGHGSYHWADGRVYEGDFCRDQRQGTGSYTWPDGAKYEGDFHRGLRHGEGRYTFKDGSVYVGEWHRGKYHGAGECKWVDGRTYKGEWKNGKAHGYGIEIRPDGSVRHDGEWKDDAPVRKANTANV